jgi:integrating conjugative element protein (TIGR03759 family)
MSWKFCLLFFLMITNFAFASDDIANTQTKNTVSQNTEINTTQIGTSKDWELTDKEWSQYLNLMKGTSAHYYKQLSPPEVLGINAESIEELQHYAEVSAKLEHDKLERELKFNAAFHDAAARLYSSEPIIKPFDYSHFTPIPKV